MKTAEELRHRPADALRDAIDALVPHRRLPTFPQAREELWEAFAPDDWQKGGTCVHYACGPAEPDPRPWPEGLRLEHVEWVLRNVTHVRTLEAQVREAHERFLRIAVDMQPNYYRRFAMPFGIKWQNGISTSILDHEHAIVGWCLSLYENASTQERDRVIRARTQALHKYISADAPAQLIPVAGSELLAEIVNLSVYADPFEPLHELPLYLAVHRTRGWPESRMMKGVARFVEICLPDLPRLPDPER